MLATLSADPARIALREMLRAVGTEKDLAGVDALLVSTTTQTVVVKAGGEVIRDELDTFVSGLITLKAAGLFPIVVHGGGPQMNQVMDEQGIEPQYAAGLRVTDASVLRVARQVFLDANLKLVERLEQYGTRARSITSGVIQAELKDDGKIGFVGEISGLNTSLLHASIDAGCIPVLLPLAESAAGQILNVNADVVAREAAISMKPLKTIMINSKGGWVCTKQDPEGLEGVKLSRISMAEHYEEMAGRDYNGRQGTLLKLNELKLILDALPPPASISLTSASGLVHELCDGRGLGTTVTH